MLLLPEDIVKSWREQNVLHDSPSASKTISLEDELRQIMNNDVISDDEKIRQYTNVLTKLIKYKSQEYKQSNGVTMEEEEEKPSSKTISMLEKEIKKAIPSTLLKNAEIIYERVKARPDMIRWDEKGELVIRDKIIPGSNLTDLLYDAVVAKSAGNPIGFSEFYNVLHDINIPRSVVKKKERLINTFASFLDMSNRPIIKSPKLIKDVKWMN